MVKAIKRIIFRSLSMENYLRILQRVYFFAYNTGILRFSSNFKYHYYARKLIKKGDTVIDIGANLGYYSILFAKWVGNAGRVFSVEPIAIYNKIFNEKAKKHANITLYSYALGVEEKIVELVSSTQTGYLNTGLPHVYDPDKDGAIEAQEFKFEAQMRTPSKLFGDLDKIDYIKCDIEGFEYVVLSEMKEVIRKHKPKLQVEVWDENEEKLLELLDELGYQPYKLKNGKPELQTKNNNISGDYIFLQKETI